MLFIIVASSVAHAGPQIQGADAADKSLKLRNSSAIVDTALFNRALDCFRGISILSAGYSLKEQRFGVAIIYVILLIILEQHQSGLKISSQLAVVTEFLTRGIMRLFRDKRQIRA